MPLGVTTPLPRGLGLWRSPEPAAVADQGERAALLLAEKVDLRLLARPWQGNESARRAECVRGGQNKDANQTLLLLCFARGGGGSSRAGGRQVSANDNDAMLREGGGEGKPGACGGGDGRGADVPIRLFACAHLLKATSPSHAFQATN